MVSEKGRDSIPKSPSLHINQGMQFYQDLKRQQALQMQRVLCLRPDLVPAIANCPDLETWLNYERAIKSYSAVCFDN